MQQCRRSKKRVVPVRTAMCVQATRCDKGVFGFAFFWFLVGLCALFFEVIIDPAGNISYNGAIDNTQGSDPDDAEPGPAANFVTPILTKLAAKESVPYQETKPWGCTVKYAK